MDKINFKKLLLYISIILVIFLLDRISKLYVLSVLEEIGNVDIKINSFLNIILVWNSGIGFGLLSFEKPFIYDFITFFIGIINIIILYLVFKSKDIRAYFFIIILGGSLGNLFDRVFYKAVPDFIDLNYNDYHWFIFNIADIFITIGIICLIFIELMNYKKG